MTRGCFVYLVHHTAAAVADGARSLASVQAHYLQSFPAPVLLFHEAGLTAEMRAVLLATGVDVQFVPVDFGRYPTTTGITAEGVSCRAGYMHMCRFFATEIFAHPALEPFDYFCRFDTDSMLLGPIGYDLFAHAAAVDASYGFLNDAIEDHQFSRDLWATARAFVDSYPGYRTYARLGTDIPEGRLYYTNFEVCRLSWFRSPPWRVFARFIDEAGGIYAHRWGDHLIRYLGVRLFMPPAQIHRYAGIPYRHQGIGAGAWA